MRPIQRMQKCWLQYWPHLLILSLFAVLVVIVALYTNCCTDVDEPTITTTTLDAVALRDAQQQTWLAQLQPGATALDLQYGAHHPGATLGRVIIPAVGVDTPLVQGSYSDDMSAEHRRGAVHWPDSVFPGMPADDEHYYGSNCQISGRLSGSLKPFERLDELLTGDVVILELPYATIRYNVIRSPEVVGENEVIGLMSGKNLLYLSASYSEGGSAYRLVVACEIVDVELVQE
jgi:LPXTG-site transpeptidase (sortase) family protein